MTTTIVVKNLEEIKRRFGNAGVKRTLDISIRKYIYSIEREAKKETPIRTGRLRSWFVSEFRPWYGRLYNPIQYAIYVHDGVWPYKIKPTKKKALYRKWAQHPVRAVNHPWIKANPFMTRAVNTVDKYVDTIFEKEIDNLLKQW